MSAVAAALAAALAAVANRHTEWAARSLGRTKKGISLTFERGNGALHSCVCVCECAFEVVATDVLYLLMTARGRAHGRTDGVCVRPVPAKQNRSDNLTPDFLSW